MSRFYLYQAVKVKWVHRAANQHKVGTESIISDIIPNAWEYDDGDAYKLAGIIGLFTASQLEPISYTPDGEEELEEEVRVAEYVYLHANVSEA